MAEQQMAIEADLILKAKNGNENAFGVLYQRHIDAIYAYIYKRVSSVCEAEDLSQTVFLKAWQAICNYQPSTSPFRAWLYRIAHNAVIDYYRTQNRSVQWDDLSTFADPANTPESALLEMERQETVQQAVATLRPSYRDVITYRFLESKDYAETADLLNRQVNNVRVLQHRALDALRRTLSQESAIWIALVATALTLFFGTTIVEAATRALPDERLYPLRTFVEETRLAIADDAAGVRLHAEFANRRLADLETLAEAELAGIDQDGQNRVEAIETTVTQLVSHIAAASAKVDEMQHADNHAVVDTGSNNATMSAQFGQLLNEQAASLAELESTSAPATQSIMQSAFEAVDDARRRLDGDAPPALPKPQPAYPAGDKLLEPQVVPSSELPADSLTQPLPASQDPGGATSAMSTAPIGRQDPVSNNRMVEDEPIEPRRAIAGEATLSSEPQRAADEASSDSSSAPQFAQVSAEQQEPSRPRQEPPSDALLLPEQDLPAPSSEDMQAATESMSETSPLKVQLDGLPSPESRIAPVDVPVDVPIDGEPEQPREDTSSTSDEDADAPDSARDNRSSREAPAELQPDRSDSRPTPQGK